MAKTNIEEGNSEKGQPWLSTTHDDFKDKRPPAHGNEGIRKHLLRKILWEKTQQELNEELNFLREERQPVPTTHYKETFTKEGFVPKPIKTNPEDKTTVLGGHLQTPISNIVELIKIHRQYPLYGDRDRSLWMEKLPNLPGATKAPHIAHQFRRYAGFTTRVDQALDTFDIR